MRRLLVFCICMSLAVAGCAQEDSATTTDNPDVTVLAEDAAESVDEATTTEPTTATPDAGTTSSETTTTTEVAATTTKAQVTTTVPMTAAEVAETFNSYMANVVELANLLSDEFGALKASIREHRADLIKGDRGDSCCNAHIETIKALERSITEENWAAREFTDELSPWVDELTMPTGGMVGMVDDFLGVSGALADASPFWRGIERALESGNLSDIEEALDELDECIQLADDIAKIGATCCTVQLDE